MPVQPLEFLEPSLQTCLFSFHGGQDDKLTLVNANATKNVGIISFHSCFQYWLRRLFWVEVGKGYYGKKSQEGRVGEGWGGQLDHFVIDKPRCWDAYGGIVVAVTICGANFKSLN